LIFLKHQYYHFENLSSLKINLAQWEVRL